MQRVGQRGEVIGQHVGLGGAENQRPCRLRQSAAVDKICIREMCVPIEVVIDGVVNSSFVFAPIAEVQRGDAEMVKKRSKIGAGTKSPDAQISAAARFLSLLG